MLVLSSRVIRSSRLLHPSHLVAAVFAEDENALSKKLPLRLLPSRSLSCGALQDVGLEIAQRISCTFQ